ncbi:MAG: hypothetical protein ACRED8_12405, partial [Caulobacteraceae bacterium]
SERSASLELDASHRSKRDQAHSAAEAIIVPNDTLEVANNIESLERNRPEIERMRKDLPGKAARLERIDSALAMARETCGLSPSAQFPTSGWRKRARRLLENVAALKSDATKNEDASRGLEREHRTVTDALRSVPQEVSSIELLESVSALQPRAFALLSEREAVARRAELRAARTFASLGFRGSAEALRGAVLPSIEEGEEHNSAIAQAEKSLREAIEAGDVSRAEMRQQRAKLKALNVGGELPTPALVAASRSERDRALADVAKRFARERRTDDSLSIARLENAIAEADRLADGRDAKSREIAEHELATSALSMAEGDLLAAEQAIERARAKQTQVEDAWSAVLSRGGLPHSLRPSGFPKWKENLERWLVELEEAELATEALGRERASLDAAENRLLGALSKTVVKAKSDLPGRLEQARLTIDQFETAAQRRAVLTEKLENLAAAVSSFKDAAAAMERRRAELEGERDRLLSEAGIAPAAAPLEDILEALEGIDQDMG